MPGERTPTKVQGTLSHYLVVLQGNAATAGNLGTRPDAVAGTY